MTERACWISPACIAMLLQRYKTHRSVLSASLQLPLPAISKNLKTDIHYFHLLTPVLYRSDPPSQITTVFYKLEVLGLLHMYSAP